MLDDCNNISPQPIQRIPRYVLLLADLMRKTAKGDKTYRQLRYTAPYILCIPW